MKNTLFLLVTGLLCFFIVSCGPKIQTLVDQGSYDETIRIATKKLVGERSKSPKFVSALETSFNKANAEDLDRARRMEVSSTPDWKRVYSYYRNKAEILREISERGIRLSTAALDTALETPGTPTERLKLAVDRVTQLIIENQEYIVVYER